eukprot:scaffold482087_cov50-Prasinocladus_malaysianus.AAC.1
MAQMVRRSEERVLRRCEFILREQQRNLRRETKLLEAGKPRRERTYLGCGSVCIIEGDAFDFAPL